MLLLAVDVVEAVAAQRGLLDHLEHEALARRAVRAENCGAREAAADRPAADEVLKFQRHEILLFGGAALVGRDFTPVHKFAVNAAQHARRAVAGG